ncbi:MAG: AMP-binding protein [Clostridiaceae bacterium]|jgi:acetyl-CoA synthetase|nr:AMP-binding protein [Clostridiaceae bacterium]
MIEKFLPRVHFDSYEDFKANYKVNLPENFNFAYDVVDAWAIKEPYRTAMVWCNDEAEERIFSFADMKRLSDKAANLFVSHDIKKGDVVMLMLKRRWHYWVCTLALEKIGAISIPATVQLTKKDIVYRNNAASVKMIVSVSDHEIVSYVEEAMDESPTVECKALVGCVRDGWLDFDDELEKASPDWTRPIGSAAAGGYDNMLMYFTSGTTGMPKIVLHDFYHPIGHIVTAHYWQRLKGDELHLTVSESGWAKCGWGKIYGQWICGVALFVYDMEKFVPDRLLHMIEKYRVTSFCAPPTIYRFMIKDDLSKYDLSSIKMACTAGEPLNPEVYSQFKKATGLNIIEGFGQTETTVLCANFEWITPKPGSMGKPSPLYDIDIVDENGKTCPPGVEGKIVIKNLDNGLPPGLFKGYYRDEEATSRVWSNGTYNTGDMAWRDEDGYFWFVGRSDDVIKCSGYRIGPFEVESALMEHPSVLECAVTAVPDPVRGQVVKATIILAKGWSGSDALVKELQNYVKKVTAPYKYPRIIEFVDELPKTISGKIKRKEIRERE